MSPSEETLEPAYTDAQREELGHIDYFLERLAGLRDRGLIECAAFDTAAGEVMSRRETIHRAGQYEACMVKCKALARSRSQQAIEWAERAIQIDRQRIDGWRIIVERCWSQEDDQAAIAWCAQGAELFPELEAELARLRAERAPREERRLERAQRAKRAQEAFERLPQIRRAVEEQRFSEACAMCDQILAEQPDHLGALANKAFALRNLGEVDRALQVYHRLMQLEPGNSVWTRCVQELRKERLPSVTKAKRDRQEEPAASMSPPEPVFVPEEHSWSGFASEFVKEHWQKLILSLAVLLIVVSSTVGRISCLATCCGLRRESARWRWRELCCWPRWARGSSGGGRDERAG